MLKSKGHKRKRWSQADKKEIVRLYNNGKSSYAIAKIMHSSQASVYYVIKKACEQGLAVKLNRAGLSAKTPYDPAEVIKLYQQGQTVNKIAKSLGIEEFNVRYTVNSYFNKQKLYLKAIDLYNSGLTYHEIAKKLLISDFYVYELISKAISNNLAKSSGICGFNKIDRQIIQYYLKELNVAKTAQVFNKTDTFVRTRIDRYYQLNPDVKRIVNKKGHRLSPKIIDEMIQDFTKGLYLKDICKKYHVTLSTIYRHITAIDNYQDLEKKRNAIIRPQINEKRYGKLRRRNQQIAKLYQDGKTINDLAKQFNLSASHIRRLLTKSNVNLRYVHDPVKIKQRNQQIIRLSKQGLSVKDIKKQIPVSQDTIYAVIRQNKS